MTPQAAPQMSVAAHEQPHRRSGKVAVGGAVVGVLALVAAGVFAAGQLSNDNAGGADSPEAVGMEMMNALEQEDMLGMVDLLLPGERDVFREPLIDVVSELSRLDIASAEASLADLSGLDIDMVDEAVTVESTNVADISNITMSASILASLDGDQLPIGDLITDLAGEDFDPSTLDQPTTTEDFNLPMTVVEDDGRWYLSVFYTAAEAARTEFGDPIPEVGLEPRGGATPQGAIDALLDGVEQLDLGKVIAGINPNEAAALQRYAPLFLDNISPMADDIGLDWQVTRSEYDVAGSGSKRFVTITALRIDGTLDESTFFIELADGCVVAEASGDGVSERVDSCALAAEAGEAPTTFDDFFGGALDIEEVTAAYEEAFANYTPPGLTVQEVDGQWFVSPIGTGFDQFLALLSALDREELDRLIDTATTFVDDLASQFDELLNDDLFGTDVFADDPFADDVPVEFEDDFSDTDFDAEQAILADCYGLEDVDVVISCLVGAVDAGDIPDYYVGVELRFPECGVAEQSLGRAALFDLSDAEYTATLEGAATCFADLIASGEVDEFDVPAEYLRPECAEGRNPWNFEQDDSFFDRWIECIYS
jgi:hypothetical protein